MNSTKKAQSPLAQILKSPQWLSIVKESDLIQAILIAKAKKAAYFDVGPFGTGIVYGAEYGNASDIIKNLKVGDAISAKVVDSENDEGYVELSLAEAGAQKNWEVVKDLKERGEIIIAKITGANSGGLLTEVSGVKAFLPVSQLSPDHYPRVEDGDRGKILEALKKLVGEELKVKVIDVKPRAEKLIVSEREIAEENNREVLNQYKVGDIVDGTISGVADFGAFVRFLNTPQIEGLVHISELDHKLIENPKEIVKIGDVVKVKLLEIKDGRVSLSLKALKPDPWAKVEELYSPGAEVRGTIARFNPFGAFVALPGDVQGLIHVSEFGSIEDMKKQIEVQKTYLFKIELVKGQDKRIILKLKK